MYLSSFIPTQKWKQFWLQKQRKIMATKNRQRDTERHDDTTVDQSEKVSTGRETISKEEIIQQCLKYDTSVVLC